MGIDRSLRTTFDEVADLYDLGRPSYSDALIDDIVQLSGLQPGGQILEVGCGPGNATVAFAQRGYRIVAIELGRRLAALARAHCRAYPKVEIINSTFEDWAVEENAFDLAISANAFHWIPPAISYPKLARALRPGGTAALFWFVADQDDSEGARAMEAVYGEHTPGLRREHDRTFEWTQEIITSNFAQSGCYGAAVPRRHTWTETVSADRYVANLRTHTSLRKYGGAAQQALVQGIHSLIESFGGAIEVHWQVALFVAEALG